MHAVALPPPHPFFSLGACVGGEGQKAKSYLVGGSHHEPEKRITVKRLVAGTPASKRCPLRPTIGQPVEEWDGRFDVKLGTCCKPWVSFGTPRSVVLSWYVGLVPQTGWTA